ncbi:MULTISPECIES: fumarylacetoacetate hydrolase family protein [unclassified Mesorhizobium]|uniref:fumarylacetoacetate hydrolase family protein n=1 Tax=unclassified Mesorhizobium TaxID=325217 RepID=UPI000FCB4244|nr:MULTISPECIES: fumarylacetoacetate hydrolase family protein [unclassified Mesorhizobium]TGP18235.1 FAA hydrolase family protein [Mesorhizobium sp. M1D.F.Ca.ET.231.01.1.1]TGP25473.1 FAA hydrolase family protein [Mesorhizobium sp. M1D.F.Ca.ET.234.01.1.1]TGS38359.1 FAA hydrolase family protein [Mesorhizobium sp. M1D.F.Ca.ET.184.01.1.1]TGS58366.1 FAA hydrolase family protein [Mesorhizobium sp. M1D.F.Ca.ET.183.01.1.1]
MKLVSYDRSGSWQPGIVLDSTVFDISMLLEASGADARAGSSMSTLLREHGSSLPELSKRLTTAAKASPRAAVGPLAATRLGPPVADPAKVLCIGLNYNDHVAETGRALPTHPDIFAKFASTLIGPSDEIRCSNITQNLDFEGELAIVIGRQCRGVAALDALSYVAGLTVLNDITARDLQYKGTQWLAGKAVDASTPCGPAIVTLDEVDDVQNLDIQTRVNGVQVQSSNTRYMIFPVRDLVSYISFFLTLSPGDIITTGTPQGIGAKRQPPLWLKPGDTVEVELQQIGLLRNVVR